MRSILVCLAVVGLTVQLSIGGDRTGTLKGSVREVAGAHVPGARVVIQTWLLDVRGTGQFAYMIDSFVMTDASGKFSLTLKPGEYDVFVSHPALEPTAKRIKIEAASEITLDFVLDPARRTSTINESLGGTRALGKSAFQSDPYGWLDLLPDASLQGWTRVSIPPGKEPEPISQWRVETDDRILVCEGTGGHEWLRFDREFADFIFHVEWRFTRREGANGYNSGIFVRNSADGLIWHQAQTGASGGGFLFGDTLVEGVIKRVSLRSELKENRVHEAGEWNTFELRCQGKTITLWVNGALTNEFTSCDVPKGFVGLEAEGYRIEFRNLKLKELP